LHFDRHGNRVWASAQTLLDSEHARRAVSEVSVPFGTCREPSNVAAAGQACPFRFRCIGCDHFRTDASYVPDLTSYLGDLLRTRERLTAALAASEQEPGTAAGGIDQWAAADAMPSAEEITRLRALIARITASIDELPAAERAAVDEAVSVARRHRTVMLGMPASRHQALPAARGALTTPPRSNTHDIIGKPRRTVPDRGDDRRAARRHRPPAPARARRAGHNAAASGQEISVSAIARQARVDRTFLYRHRDLLEQVHARETQPPGLPGGGPTITRQSLQADLLASRERSVRLTTRIRQLEHRLSEVLGEQAWRESGLGAHDDVSQLRQQITQLTDDNQQLRATLAERDQDLDGARAPTVSS
jgi:hypothetical protein